MLATATVCSRMRLILSSSKQILGGSHSLNLKISSGSLRPLHTTQTVMMGRRSAKIATRKGKADAQKAKLYGKIGKLIAQAVRSGGADPIANARLREYLAQAKVAQVPTDIIDRNLKKASDKNAADYSEMTYEAYGVGGSGFIIEALTDNVNRTAAEVRNAVAKSGGKMADVGSVMFNFNRQGVIMVDRTENEDAVFEAAMDAGASDFQPVNDSESGGLEGFKVLTSLDSITAVTESLSAQGLKLNMESSGILYVPLASVELNDEDYASNEAMLERLLALDDVDAVYANFQ